MLSGTLAHHKSLRMQDLLSPRPGTSEDPDDDPQQSPYRIGFEPASQE